MKYRIYVDEVGNADLGASLDPNHRYLSLTGVIMELGYVEATVFPKLEGLKGKYFASHPDEPVVLHRKEVINRKTPFDSLQDPEIERRFSTDLLALLRELDYVVITSVIDKLEHLTRYRVWRFDPYHYCLTVLIERFVRWLDARNAVGDVMVESRGGREDMRLKTTFQELYDKGTDYVKPELIAARLTSRQLKVKSKANNIAGLQLADLIAHPSYKATVGMAIPPFGGQIVAILEESKYYRSPSGRILGWGQKCLP